MDLPKENINQELSWESSSSCSLAPCLSSCTLNQGVPPQRLLDTIVWHSYLRVELFIYWPLITGHNIINLFSLLNIVLMSLYWCFYTTFNASESSSSFFSWYKQTISSLVCNALCEYSSIFLSFGRFVCVPTLSILRMVLIIL